MTYTCCCCKKEFAEIPDNAKPFPDFPLVTWTCECGSNVCAPKEEAQEARAA